MMTGMWYEIQINKLVKANNCFEYRRLINFILWKFGAKLKRNSKPFHFVAEKVYIFWTLN